MNGVPAAAAAAMHAQNCAMQTMSCCRLDVKSRFLCTKSGQCLRHVDVILIATDVSRAKWQAPEGTWLCHVQLSGVHDYSGHSG